MVRMSIYNELLAELTSGKASVLVRIIRKVGSAPRTAGTALLLKADGNFVGTVGGGRLEHDALRRAKEVLGSGRSAVLPLRLSGQDVEAAEMLCGGEVDVLLELISPEDRLQESVFRELLAMKDQGRRGALISIVPDRRQGGNRFLITAEGDVIGDASGVPDESSVDLKRWAGAREPLLETLSPSAARAEIFIEPVGSEEVLLLFGAGHISARVAPLARMVGFQVYIIDDREEFANPRRFPSADRLVVCPVAKAFDRIAVTPATYIAIVTRGHLHDRDALRAALRTRPAYLGMIGSRRKREMIYASLAEEGVSAEGLRQVRCPIGIDIGAQTPEEIAVSIVAELIRVRAEAKTAGPPTGEAT